MYYPEGMKARVNPVQWSKPNSILVPTQDSNPGSRIQNHKRWPLHYHCTLLYSIAGQWLCGWGIDPSIEESPVWFPRPPNFWLIALGKLLTLWCPRSPSCVNWYQLAGWGWDTVSINATQSHSRRAFRWPKPKRLYAIPEKSTYHFSWTRPGETLTRPDPLLLTKSLTRPAARRFP